MPYLHLIDEAIGLLNTEIRLIEWRIKYPEQLKQRIEKQSLSNNRFPTKNREYPYPIQCYARHGIFVGWLQYFQSHGKFLAANNPLFKAGQADAMTACFSEYSRKVLSKAKSNRVPIREQLKQAADQLSKEKPKQKERAKEVAHEDR